MIGFAEAFGATTGDARFRDLAVSVAGISSFRLYQPASFVAGDGMLFDNLAFRAPVPEPTSWAMLVAGFGLAGLALRRRRQPAIAA